MTRIHLDSAEITRNGSSTKEFAATFRYMDLAKIAELLVLQELRETGQLTGDEGKRLRVETRFCQPDGDMGWPGARVEVVMMEGAADYYPRLLESGGRRPALNKLEPVGMNLFWASGWRALRQVFGFKPR